MTLLAYQLNHPDFHAVQALDCDELFYEAKFDRFLAFHQFPAFIKTEVDKFYLLKTKNAEPDRFLGREEELKDYVGAKIFVDSDELQAASPDRGSGAFEPRGGGAALSQGGSSAGKSGGAMSCYSFGAYASNKKPALPIQIVRSMGKKTVKKDAAKTHSVKVSIDTNDFSNDLQILLRPRRELKRSASSRHQELLTPSDVPVGVPSVLSSIPKSPTVTTINPAFLENIENLHEDNPVEVVHDDQSGSDMTCQAYRRQHSQGRKSASKRSSERQLTDRAGLSPNVAKEQADSSFTHAPQACELSQEQDTILKQLSQFLDPHDAEIERERILDEINRRKGQLAAMTPLEINVNAADIKPAHLGLGATADEPERVGRTLSRGRGRLSSRHSSGSRRCFSNLSSTKYPPSGHQGLSLSMYIVNENHF